MSEEANALRHVRKSAAEPRSPRSRAASRPEVREAGRAGGAINPGASSSDHGRSSGDAKAQASEPGSTAAVPDLVIGIDPGVHTGIALRSIVLNRFHAVQTMGVVEAMLTVQRLAIEGRIKLVVIEDARLRKWFGTKGREALQGAGSIKRECAIWIDWLTLNAIPHRVVSPQAKGAKVNAERFTKLTGWDQRTSEHARDAAMLVFGVNS